MSGATGRPDDRWAIPTRGGRQGCTYLRIGVSKNAGCPPWETGERVLLLGSSRFRGLFSCEAACHDIEVVSSEKEKPEEPGHDQEYSAQIVHGSDTEGIHQYSRRPD